MCSLASNLALVLRRNQYSYNSRPFLGFGGNHVLGVFELKKERSHAHL